MDFYTSNAFPLPWSSQHPFDHRLKSSGSCGDGQILPDTDASVAG
jgi:hypothetical protein